MRPHAEDRGGRFVCMGALSYNLLYLCVYNSSYSPVCMWAWVWALSQMCFLSQTVFWSVGSGTVEADVESSWVLSNPWLQPCSLNCVSSFTVTAALELLASILSYGSDVHWGRKEERGGRFQAQESIRCLYKATSMFEHNKNINSDCTTQKCQMMHESKNQIFTLFFSSILILDFTIWAPGVQNNRNESHFFNFFQNFKQ